MWTFGTVHNKESMLQVLRMYNFYCGSVCFKVVQLLLSSNMCAAMLEPKPSDPNGVSPLHLAAKNGHIEVIRSENLVLSVCLSLSMCLSACPLCLPVGQSVSPSVCPPGCPI